MGIIHSLSYSVANCNASGSAPTAHYFRQRDLLNIMTRDYTGRAQNLLMIGLVVIMLLLVWRYKSPLKALQTLFPAIMAALLILGL